MHISNYQSVAFRRICVIRLDMIRLTRLRTEYCSHREMANKIVQLLIHGDCYCTATSLKLVASSQAEYCTRPLCANAFSAWRAFSFRWVKSQVRSSWSSPGGPAALWVSPGTQKKDLRGQRRCQLQRILHNWRVRVYNNTLFSSRIFWICSCYLVEM